MSDIESLAEVLHVKSLEGKIHWTPMGNPGWLASNDIRLQSRQGDSYIEITKYAVLDREHIELSVRNRDGILLAQKGFEPGETFFADLDQIVDIARRQSLGVDGALSDLRARLEAL